MKNTSRIMLSIIITCLSLSFVSNAMGITSEQEQELLQVVKDNLQKPENINIGAAQSLAQDIRKEKSIDEIYRKVTRSPIGSIDKEIIKILIKKFPHLTCDLFMMAKRAGLADAEIYSAYIIAAGDNGYFDVAKSAFDDATRKDLDDEYIYSDYINVAGKANNFDEAQRAYNEAREKGLAEHRVYSKYIIVAGNTNNFDEARRAFYEAKGKRWAWDDRHIYSIYIDAAGNTGHFTEAQRAFDEARERKLADVVVYGSYITAAGKAGDFAEAQMAYDEARKRKLVNEVIYGSYITAAGNAGDFAEAQMAYNEARKRKLVNEVIYGSYIAAAGNTNNFAEAQMAYNEARKRNLVNEVIYDSYIAAAGDAGDFAEAQMAYNEIRARNLVNEVTYGSYIAAAGNAGDFAEAQKAYREAIRLGLTNYITYNAYIDVLIQQGMVDHAIKIFLEAYPKYINCPEKDGYDFHGFSFGAAYVAAHLLIDQAHLGDEINIIVGRGSHSRDEEIVRRAVELFVTRAGGAVVSSRTGNPGVLRLRLVSPYDSTRVINTTFLYQNNPEDGESHWNIANQHSQQKTVTPITEIPTKKSEEDTKQEEKKRNREGKRKIEEKEPISRQNQSVGICDDDQDRATNARQGNNGLRRAGLLAGQMIDALQNDGMESFIPYK